MKWVGMWYDALGGLRCIYLIGLTFQFAALLRLW